VNAERICLLNPEVNFRAFMITGGVPLVVRYVFNFHPYIRSLMDWKYAFMIIDSVPVFVRHR
jgi:hypothetical protein